MGNPFIDEFNAFRDERNVQEEEMLETDRMKKEFEDGVEFARQFHAYVMDMENVQFGVDMNEYNNKDIVRQAQEFEKGDREEEKNPMNIASRARRVLPILPENQNNDRDRDLEL